MLATDCEDTVKAISAKSLVPQILCKLQQSPVRKSLSLPPKLPSVLYEAVSLQEPSDDDRSEWALALSCRAHFKSELLFLF